MTIAEIKTQMTDAFISNPVVIEKHELEDGKTFEEQFSVVSIESILFFVTATAVWLCSQLFDRFKIDISDLLETQKAHTPNWYASKSKAFLFGYQLSDDTDAYNTTLLTPEQIQAAQTVRYSAATETSDSSILFLKIAGESNGMKQPLSAAEITAFNYYLNRIKDAGVRITVINSPADNLRLQMDIYYNPLLLDGAGRRLDGTDDTPVQRAIREYISDLPFNGLYTNQSLIDKLQTVEGVEIAELQAALSRYGTISEYVPINARSIPYAGYYQISDADLLLNFIANE